jgi:predicted signal transduction protein with EAL and GGDEF domain
MVVIAIMLAGLVLARQVLVQRDLVQAQERLRHRALHDALTGLPNRTLVLERPDRLLSSARRSGRRVPALFLDIDGLKSVNDTLGHAVGDSSCRPSRPGSRVSCVRATLLAGLAATSS